MIQYAVALLLFAAGGAVVLSVAQAWAMVAPTKRSRYLFVWALGTSVLAFPIVFSVWYGDAAAHYNVAWTAIVLSALTTAAALTVAAALGSSWAVHIPALWQRAQRLFPIHFGVLVVLGAVSMLLLMLVFVGNIH